MSLLTMAFSLFLLIDPIGNIPFFISILKGIPPKRQFQIILRELIIALVILIGFHFVGNFLLEALNISQYAVLITGGIILFLLSLKMIFPSDDNPDFHRGKEKEPFIVPLAVPLVAGPAALAAIILYSNQAMTWFVPISAIILAWIVSAMILLSSAGLNKILGARGIVACERLMGLLLTMMAVQMLLRGITQYVETL